MQLLCLQEQINLTNEKLVLLMQSVFTEYSVICAISINLNVLNF